MPVFIVKNDKRACDRISAEESAAELLLLLGDGVLALSVPVSSGSLNSEKNDKVEK